ncbi:hypothetical protein [Carnobacterium divergens]|uniref:hypothetical protein n=1 Tax=Carnobacterium divergens TaxID=2748 RepID=UPI00107296EF|nr:hypothetical protein [Carnobacterium divergens]TFI73203.1 hypothetical protein CKN81_06860 [Carnobacterium divergens]
MKNINLTINEEVYYFALKHSIDLEKVLQDAIYDYQDAIEYGFGIPQNHIKEETAYNDDSIWGVDVLW